MTAGDFSLNDRGRKRCRVSGTEESFTQLDKSRGEPKNHKYHRFNQLKITTFV